MAEVKNRRLWNFMKYQYPDGEAYDFGDYKDGEGTVVHLNDEGTPCLECTTINKKITGKSRCEEE